MFPRRILAIIFFFYFLVLHQQANININLMICCLLLMQNLRAQNILVTRCIRRQRNRYRRRAPYYWTLPRPVESWFEIHYTDRTIPGDYFRRLLRMNRESFNLLLNVIRNRLTRQNTDYEDTNSSLTTAAHEHKTVNQDKIQQDRLERIRNYCNASRNNKNIFHKLPNRNHFNFVVSEKHKFIICYVPKTGCSQWKDLLLNVLAVRPVTPNHDISLFDYSIFKFLNEFSVEERKKMLESYQKFYFVREPFERLLSAYRDKFVGKTTHLYETVAQKIIQKVRGVGRDKENGGRPTLAEFTTYLNQLPDPSSWDMHWRPAHQTCYPCAVGYNYVGYFDTIKEDADYILKKLQLDDQFQFPAFRSHTSVLLEKHYSQIPLHQIVKLADIYREDFEMFGFKYPATIKKLFKDWV